MQEGMSKDAARYCQTAVGFCYKMFSCVAQFSQNEPKTKQELESLETLCLRRALSGLCDITKDNGERITAVQFRAKTRVFIF